jgi:hypothetical protein
MKKVILGLLLLCTFSNAKITYGDRIHVNYGRGNGFDGTVQDIRGNMLRVKVINVQLKGFFVLHLNPTTCSGNEMLSASDRKLIWIPKSCVN